MSLDSPNPHWEEGSIFGCVACFQSLNRKSYRLSDISRTMAIGGANLGCGGKPYLARRNRPFMQKRSVFVQDPLRAGRQPNP
jgi:hypothetical protein